MIFTWYETGLLCFHIHKVMRRESSIFAVFGVLEKCEDYSFPIALYNIFGISLSHKPASFLGFLEDL